MMLWCCHPLRHSVTVSMYVWKCYFCRQQFIFAESMILQYKDIDPLSENLQVGMLPSAGSCSATEDRTTLTPLVNCNLISHLAHVYFRRMYFYSRQHVWASLDRGFHKQMVIFAHIHYFAFIAIDQDKAEQKPQDKIHATCTLRNTNIFQMH